MKANSLLFLGSLPSSAIQVITVDIIGPEVNSQNLFRLNLAFEI